jgi:hypothetical protein
MTKQEILDEFSDINLAYNNSSKHETLSWMLDELLKEQEVRELTIDEWREWKANPKRDPICTLWENDTSPMWTLNPNDVHEPALLMGKLKLFTGKPTFEQCKEVKWE